MGLRIKDQKNDFFVVVNCTGGGVIIGGDSVTGVGGSFGVAHLEGFGGVTSYSMVGGIGVSGR